MFWQAAISVFLAWLSTRVIKLITDIFLKKEKLNFKILFNDGGFPSSHTAFVFGLAMTVYLVEGFTMAFLVSLVLAFIVSYDAMKVRWIVGEHSKRLNETAKKGAKKFVERVGHTPFEVFGGAIVGLLVPILLYWAVF